MKSIWQVSNMRRPREAKSFRQTHSIFNGHCKNNIKIFNAPALAVLIHKLVY